MRSLIAAFFLTAAGYLTGGVVSECNSGQQNGRLKSGLEVNTSPNAAVDGIGKARYVINKLTSPSNYWNLSWSTYFGNLGRSGYIGGQNMSIQLTDKDPYIVFDNDGQNVLYLNASGTEEEIYAQAKKLLDEAEKTYDGKRYSEIKRKPIRLTYDLQTGLISEEILPAEAGADNLAPAPAL